ncbi:Bug family tripartite tricarboxylate transporter substrate binding protein [Allopusillimonas ginsengisoli]|uniref:Bug family tripartite tricarboxylate transporter substrate binding protein n=1 Tax=Allopusillimonas ginsengisoli TaxID=453575 RepID=UPI0010C175F5|nr:tripartite tricarboxylate transporter substrate binding protein [Allopusillimonas ginsengisoli]
MKMQKLVAGLACTMAVTLGSPAIAAYPDQPIRFVVGFPPGGSTDIVTRILSEGLSKELNQTVLVDNKPGAGGAIAAQWVANAKPDGYTIFLGTVATNVINPLLRKSIKFDPIKDFTMIGEVGFYTNLVLVNADSKYQNLGELIADAKSKPMSYSSPGAGTSPHMTGEYFKMLTQTDIQHIPFQGSGPALTALMGSHVDVGFDNLPAALGLVQSGKVRALAITSTERIKELPDVPTADELGVEGMNVDAWVSVIGPAGIPDDRLQTLSKALLKVLSTPETAEKLESNAVTIKGTSPAELQEYIASETKKWRDVVETSGVSLD